MGFPARDRFEGDRRITPRLMRLYKFCRLEFDFWDVRSRKSEVLAHATGITREDVGSALDKLRDYGYLVEHARGEKNSRWFTLAWSVNPALAAPVVVKVLHKKRPA